MTIPDITKAANILKSGGLVAFPTETVYGLGADATNETAVRNIFIAKERPYDHPLIVHVANISQLAEWARDIPPQALQLAQAFWPGPLTMILKKQPDVLDIVTGDQDTIGLRIPRHPVAMRLLEAFKGGVAAPSANRFTHISPTTAAAVSEELGGRVELILDGGDCEIGLESTIIDMSRAEPVILRPGMITRAQIEQVLSISVATLLEDTPAPRTPGMHHLHYAPRTKTILLVKDEIKPFLHNLNAQHLPVALLAFSADFSNQPGIHVETMPLQASAYAHNLYHTLRTLDNQQFKLIMIEAVPEDPIWEAIRDRLTKAAGTRD